MKESVAEPRGRAETGTPSPRRPSLLADGLVAAALSGTVWLLYRRVTGLWWTFDDVFLLHVASGRSPVEYFFSPGFWRQLPFKMFVPILLLSYDADIWMAGAEPFAFYVHQLVACCAAVVSLFVVFRKWFGTVLAGAGAFLFTVGIPFVIWAQQLMNRHYVEGFVLAALAVWFFVESLRGAQKASAWVLSAVFYGLAMLAKEVYVPLLGLLVLLPEGPLGSRLRRLRPHAIALVAYLAWRHAMIGTFFGGYGWAIRRGELLGLIFRLPGRVGATLLSASLFWNVVLLSALIAGIVWHLRRRPRGLGLILGSAALLLAPIVPVSKAVGARFGALLWVLIIAVFLSGCARLASGTSAERMAGVLLLGVTAVASLCGNRIEWRRQFEQVMRMSEEGRFFVSMESSGLLRHPSIPAAAMNEILWLKEEQLRRPRGSGWFADDIYLCGGRTPSGRIWEYDESAGRVRDVTAEALAAAPSYCTGSRGRAPLWARFEFSEGVVFWTLGPYETGKYCLIRRRGIESFPVARRDGYRLRPGPVTLMLRYESPTGWVTYSPELTMDSRVATRFRWERRGVAP